MLTRKAFLTQLANGGFAIGLTSCGGGGDSSPAAAPPAAAGTCSPSSITGNHGHALTIPSADLNSALAMSYDITGAAGHRHDITLSPAQLAQLKAGQTVTVASSIGAAHSHDVSSTCA